VTDTERLDAAQCLRNAHGHIATAMIELAEVARWIDVLSRLAFIPASECGRRVAGMSEIETPAPPDTQPEQPAPEADPTAPEPEPTAPEPDPAEPGEPEQPDG
jgi:hypothetical protein